MRRLAAALLSFAAVMLAGSSGAMAITNGQPDDGNHPYVGLMIALDAKTVPQWSCSGSLLTPTVYLTAGHCTAPPAAHVEVWFAAGPIPVDPDYLAAVQKAGELVPCNASPLFNGYPCKGDAGGTPHPNPDFCIGCGGGLPGFDFRDVGVVKFDTAVPTSVVGEYAQLPSPGVVDTLANKTPVDLVGYGVQFQAQIPGNQLPKPPPFYRWTGPLTRMFAPTELVSGNFTHSDEFIRLSLNADRGSGGTCFGDSGGPDLLGGTDTILGVNSYVTNYNCSGIGYSQRIDIPEVLTWIRSYA